MTSKSCHGAAYCPCSTPWMGNSESLSRRSVLDLGDRFEALSCFSHDRQEGVLPSPQLVSRNLFLTQAPTRAKLCFLASFAFPLM